MRWKSLSIVIVALVLVAGLFHLEGGAMPERFQDRFQDRPPHRPEVITSTQILKTGGAEIQVDFAVGALDMTPAQIMPWVERAANAVVAYYGRFPVKRARILIVPGADDEGVMQGTTWGDMRGMPGFTRIRLGQHTTEKDLREDWTMTHELVHMAFPGLPDEQHWMEEGLSTYIEPIARVQTGELKASQVWQDMIEGMPKGEPKPGDQGMDRTHTWGRTYWGGALFCVVADVEIRKHTGNRKGLQDALRAIVAAGGTIDHDWPLTQALAVGDKATGTTVLEDQYKQWGDAPMPVDLPKLWMELGVASGKDGAEFRADAPMAKIREAITAPDHSARQ